MEKEYGKHDEPDKMPARHQLLSIFKESWRDDHKFFSVRDLELCVKGLCDGMYEMVELELGADIIQAFPKEEDRQNFTIQAFRGEENGSRVLKCTMSPSQAQSWMLEILESGLPKDLSGWEDITDTVEA